MSALLSDRVALLEADDSGLHEQVARWAAAHGLQLSRLDAGALPPDDEQPALVLLAAALPRPVTRRDSCATTGKRRRSSSQRGWRSRRAAPRAGPGALARTPLVHRQHGCQSTTAARSGAGQRAATGASADHAGPGQCHGARQSVEQAAAANGGALSASLHRCRARCDRRPRPGRRGALLSAGAAELFGLARAEVLGRTASGLPFWSPELGQALARALDCDTTQTLQHEDAVSGRATRSSWPRSVRRMVPWWALP